VGRFSVGFMFTTLADAVAPDLVSLPAAPVGVLGEADVLDALVVNRWVKNLAEAHDLVLVARYLELNATSESIARPAEMFAGGERMIRPGGDGTRRVWEFAVADLAARLGRGQDSLPSMNSAPARTRATNCGALTARQRSCADSMSLNAIARLATRLPEPLVTFVRCRTVAKVDSGWWCAGGSSGA
jgi:hypothetical protein